ncbi:MAG: ATP-binding protein [Syntrophobacteraceae bacterium]
MKPNTTLDDLIGIEYAKLGFFREVQEKIAELRASNQELEGRRREIQAILDGITDVMTVLTLDLKIHSVNKVFFDVFPEPDPIGKYCHEVFRGMDKPCSPCPVITARDSNQVCRDLAISPVPSEGKNRHFQLTASPLRNSEGKPSHILLLKRDVTLEHEYQAKYYQAETMATIGVLAAGVGHEINNPLTAISGFAEGLSRRLPKLEQSIDGALFEDFSEYVGIILKECRRCQEIVQSLLTFSRQKSSEYVSVHINSLITDTRKLLRNRLKQFPEGHIRIELTDSLPAIQGDPSQLKQVVLNLMLNALDATSDRGSITLRTYALNEAWVGIAFEDTGCGIPARHLSKLFEPFFTTKPVGRGIGIGLSTCYNIVHDHGGEIVVCSEEGQGSTFLVRLPAPGADCHAEP